MAVIVVVVVVVDIMYIPCIVQLFHQRWVTMEVLSCHQSMEVLSCVSSYLWNEYNNVNCHRFYTITRNKQQ